MKSLRKRLAVFIATCALAVGLLVAVTGTASADYGPGTTYQIAITANMSGPTGGGIWIWFALTPTSASGGTVDYAGADCGHGVGAASDSGEATYTVVGGNLVISGVVYNGLPPFPVFQAPITVPATYGHYSYSAVDNPFETIFGFPPSVSIPGGPTIDFTGGHAQVQVSP
jgi:hypothetical protein